VFVVGHSSYLFWPADEEQGARLFKAMIFLKNRCVTRWSDGLLALPRVAPHESAMRAKHVETEGQLEILERLACHAGQGYLFSAPPSFRYAAKIIGSAGVI